MTESAAAAYQILDPARLRALLGGLDGIRAMLGGLPGDWRVREVGDGNLNLVFLVEGPQGSVCVKQAVPYVRVAGPSWPMSLERAYFETSYYRAVAPHAAGLVPTIHHYDPALYCTVMERLTPHIILRHGLIAGRRYPRLALDMGEYVARTCFFTSDFAQPFERKMDTMALFAGNQALVRISVDLIFSEPYLVNERNRHTSPELDGVAAACRSDGPLKMAAVRFGQKFLTSAEALLHGDLHSGSVMVTEDDTRVIDPEFAFYGPMGFDLGAFFGNLLLSWYSQPGHANRGDDRVAYQAWIRFLALWHEHGAGDAYPPALFQTPGEAMLLQSARNAFVDALMADMFGFAACKMIRRILGFAHVIDFEQIADPAQRARCEGRALAMARELLLNPERFRSVRDVLEAVPRAEL
jgi:5-methylthioribose kinase